MGEKNPEVLLDVANHSSERLAVQHTAFIAACAYVLVIVFGTTDLDLLIGKGIRLPFVDVEMPIVGFFAFAPFVLVLVHFNLLLQLQLLSRKLFAFDAAAPGVEGIGGLHDRLHIFPFTYYLVGQPSPLVKFFLAVMTSITVVLLPLFVLFSMQLQFLAYQDESVTWLQRMAIWLDIALINIFWPTILHPDDDWKGYWRALIAVHVPRRRVWRSFLLLFAGITICLFAVNEKLAFAGQIMIPLSLWSVLLRLSRNHEYGFPLLGGAILSVVILLFTGGRAFASIYLFIFALPVLWHKQAPRGSFALLLTLFGSLLPLALMVDGEHLEQGLISIQASQMNSTVLSTWHLLDDKRQLDLNEQLLFVKPPKPETLALIRSGKWKEGLTQLEPINLQHRNLRHADMSNAVLIGADFRDADLRGASLNDAYLQGANLEAVKLQGAYLVEVKLQGANLRDVNLQDAILEEVNFQGLNLMGSKLQSLNLGKANLQGADLSGANLQGTDLSGANLQGANLGEAKLQGTYLGKANLQGANLKKANLQGADLSGANLQGVDLSGANLQGVDLSGANLQGVDLSGANLYTADFTDAATTLIDAREVVGKPLGKNDVEELVIILKTVIADPVRLQEVMNRLKSASQPDAPQPYLESILAEANTQISFAKRYDPQKLKEDDDFTRQLNDFLVALASESPEIARGIIRQIPDNNAVEESSRRGLTAELEKHFDDKYREGLQGLTPVEKDDLKRFK